MKYQVLNAAESFQGFVGRIVKCVEKKDVIQFLGNDREFTTVEYDENDPTIVEIKQLTAGQQLRIFTPGRNLGTCDIRPNRINVSIAKTDNGIYKIVSINAG